jgi:uncharacterized protein (DUF2236 family)
MPAATSNTVVERIVGRIMGPRPEVAPWMRALEDGNDGGFFGPGSAVWAVNASLPTMVAGIRALLIQTLHPGAMAGVHDRSRYREDPMGRLDGTVRWIMTTTFGDREAAIAGSAFVSWLHDHDQGVAEPHPLGRRRPDTERKDGQDADRPAGRAGRRRALSFRPKRNST